MVSSPCSPLLFYSLCQTSSFIHSDMRILYRLYRFKPRIYRDLHICLVCFGFASLLSLSAYSACIETNVFLQMDCFA